MMVQRRWTASTLGGRMRRIALGGAALALVLGGWGAPAGGGASVWGAPAWADGVTDGVDDGAAKDAERPTVEADRVFFGDARNWKKPAQVDSDAVFAKIPAYQEIVEQQLDPSDAKYGLLMSKARHAFRKAVCGAAKDGGYDLVAGLGAVKGVAGVPVITDAVIAKL